MKCKVGVLVSGGGTNLQAIIDACKKEIITSGEIVVVASNKPECYALIRAENNGIATLVFKTEEELIQGLRDYGVEVVVLAGFLKILSPDFIKEYPDRIINVHPALLPSFGGKGCYGIHVHEMALEYGVKVSGATVHFVNEVPDGGKIIAQKAVDIRDDDTPETLQRRIMEEAEWVILPESIEKVCKSIVEERESNVQF